MLKRRVFFIITFACVSIMARCPAYADVRSYVWTYEYQTMPKGMWEVENYVTTKVPNMQKSNINTIEEWVELEYGITDNWDVSMYQMYKFKNKKAENDAKYDGFKVRTRYRFGKAGQFFVDPLIYLEYIREPDFSKPNIIEAKLVLAKDIGDLNISYNQILKRNLEREGKTNNGYAAGLSYRIIPRFKLGMEAKGGFNERKNYLGPTLSWNAGKFWVSLGSAFGLNRRSDDLQVRMIVGVPF